MYTETRKTAKRETPPKMFGLLNPISSELMTQEHNSPVAEMSVPFLFLMAHPPKALDNTI